MIVQEGKYYKTRDGQKVGPMEKGEQYGCGGPWLWKSCGFYFMAKGYSCRGNNGGDHHSHEDLISEWYDSPELTNGPVRTVTRREVVEGVYAHVAVCPHEPGSVLVGFAHPHDQHFRAMTASELKAAAAVLLELAGALSDGE